MRTLLPLLSAWAAACSAPVPDDVDGGDRGRDGSTPAPPDLWTPATVPFDPACDTGCIEIDRRPSTHLHGLTLSIRYHPEVDDPIAQWSLCIGSIRDCIDGEGGVPACVEASACPAFCREQIVSRLSGAATLAEELDAVQAVLVDRDGPCHPDAAEVMP
jgi:hypothetical protein